MKLRYYLNLIIYTIIVYKFALDVSRETLNTI